MKSIRSINPLLLVILISCMRQPFEVTEDTYSNGNSKLVKYYTDETRTVLLKEIRYYENGTKRMEGEYRDAQRTGQWSYWYPDGKLWSQAVYKKGKENGLRTVWHKNGQKYYEGKSVDDQRKGVWKFWDETGKLVKEIDYDQEQKSEE